MDSSSAFYFLLDVWSSLQEVAGEILAFLTEQPFDGLSWTWGSVLFGTAVFAFFAWAVVRWIVP